MAFLISSEPPVAPSVPQGKYGPIAPDRETKIQAALGEIDRAMIGFILAVSMAFSSSLVLIENTKDFGNGWLADLLGFWWLPYWITWFWSMRAVRKSRAAWPQFHSGKSESIFLPSNLLLSAGILLLVWQTLVLTVTIVTYLFSRDFPSSNLVLSGVFFHYLLASVSFSALWAISDLVKVYETIQWIKVLNGQKNIEKPFQGQTLTEAPVHHPVSPSFERTSEEN
ncbi:hypothetical protein [Aquidulcibacter sp.]|uniref:hypothetical protein n=1 Tax=Aquidulcibacter sp. TaxID=2052990 RepID=UPI0025C5DC05|nr:hypothetical protein [Aquidulcibacter sp.]MCA3694404.1 hypothetical protein [Aquidulcibacter sp.]